MSISGGYHQAVRRAKDCGCDCVQLFTRNNHQWRAKQITPDEAERFRAALAELKISHPIAHDSYLINLASSEKTLPVCNPVRHAPNAMKERGLRRSPFRPGLLPGQIGAG